MRLHQVLHGPSNDSGGSRDAFFLVPRRRSLPLTPPVATPPATPPPPPPLLPYRTALCCNLSGGSGDRFIPFITLWSCKFISCTCSEGENKTRRIFLWRFGNAREIGGRGAGNGRKGRTHHPLPTHHPAIPPIHPPCVPACLPPCPPREEGKAEILLPHQ